MRKLVSLLLISRISVWLMLTTSIACADDSSVSAVEAFGLEGIWAPDCRSPASPDNPFVYFRIAPNGQIIHAVRVGETSWALRDELQDVHSVGTNLLQFTAIRDGRPVLTATILRDGNRIQTIRSVGTDGTIYYDDGKEVATGKPSLSSEHCDENRYLTMRPADTGANPDPSG